MATLWQATGAEGTGTGTISAAWPTHVAGDLGVAFVETANEAVTGYREGWLPVPNGVFGVGTPGAAGATGLAAFWRVAASAAEPNFTAADVGNHHDTHIETFRGDFDPTNPFDVVAGGVKSSASTATSIPGVTATQGGHSVVYASTRDNDGNAGANWSAEANANLTSLTERFDDGTISGNGGGVAVWTGTLASPGATGTLTATSAASIVEAYLCITFRSPPTYTGPTVVGTVSTGSAASSTSVTVSHTLAAGSNRRLLVAVGGDETGVAGITVTGVTYNGIALAKVTDGTITADALIAATNTTFAEMWDLKEASLPANGTYDVVVTFSVAPDWAGVTVFAIQAANQATNVHKVAVRESAVLLGDVGQPIVTTVDQTLLVDSWGFSAGAASGNGVAGFAQTERSDIGSASPDAAHLTSTDDMPTAGTAMMWWDTVTQARQAGVVVAFAKPSGTTYNQSVSGSVTAAGALGRKTKIVRTGTTTPAGGLTRRTRRTLTATVTAAGAVTRKVRRTIAGATTAAGALAARRIAKRTVTGATTPVGTVTKRPRRLVAGSSTPTGALTRKPGRRLAGAATPAGNLNRNTKRALGGAATPTGTVATRKFVARLFGGVTTATGSLSRRTRRTLTATSTPAGTVTRTTKRRLAATSATTGTVTARKFIARTFGGATTPTGTVARRTRRTLTGATTPAGAVTQKTRRTVTGAITAAGVVTPRKLVTRTVAGTVAAVGALTRRTRRLLTGATTPAGTLTRQPKRTITGTTSPSGTLTRRGRKLVGGTVNPAGALTAIKTAASVTADAIVSTIRTQARRLAEAVTTQAHRLGIIRHQTKPTAPIVGQNKED